MSLSSSVDLVATGIPSTRIGDAWPALWPLIRPAYEKSKEKTDLLAGIRARDLQVFGIYEKLHPIAGIISRLLLRKMTSGSPELHAHLWLVGGERLNAWASDFLSIFVHWAKSEGCVAVTGSGRKGWTRIVARHGGYRIEDMDGEPAWRLDI